MCSRRLEPNVDVLLVLVLPPTAVVGGCDASSGWRTWVEIPALVVWAKLVPNEPEHLLRVAFCQPTTEGCTRPGNQDLELDPTRSSLETALADG